MEKIMDDLSKSIHIACFKFDEFIGPEPIHVSDSVFDVFRDLEDFTLVLGNHLFIMLNQFSKFLDQVINGEIPLYGNLKYRVIFFGFNVKNLSSLDEQEMIPIIFAIIIDNRLISPFYCCQLNEMIKRELKKIKRIDQINEDFFNKFKEEITSMLIKKIREQC